MNMLFFVQWLLNVIVCQRRFCKHELSEEKRRVDVTTVAKETDLFFSNHQNYMKRQLSFSGDSCWIATNFELGLSVSMWEKKCKTKADAN